jgi:hypothetical protein
MLYKNAALHFGIAVFLYGLWATAAGWHADSGGWPGPVTVLAVLSGIAWATVIHEWFHLAGARLAGAKVSAATGYALLVFDFDFAANTLRQFNLMSIAGQLGSWVAVFALWWLAPVDSAGRGALIGGAVGSAVFAAGVELPPWLRSQRSGDPLAELSKIDKAALTGSAVAAVAAALPVWLLTG